MPSKPWFGPVNDDPDASKHTWVFEIGGVRYQLEPQEKRKPALRTRKSSVKQNAVGTPIWMKQLDFRKFIKFISYNQQSKQPSPSKTKSEKPRAPQPLHPGWVDVSAPFGCQWLIYRRPEGYGKSSLVRDLIDKERTVIFCSRSNKQLIEHEENFKSRWPYLKIHRHISKAQHLSEGVQLLTGQEFKLVTTPSMSPYGQELVDVQASLEKLRELVGENAEAIYAVEYETWKAPEIDGKLFDIILITLSAFQALCTGYRKLWWEHFNLSEKIYPIVDSKGFFTSFPEREIKQRGYWGDDGWVADANGTSIHYVPDPKDDGSRTAPTSKIVIIVDDPDKSDFDWMRRIDGEDDAAELYSLTNKKGTKHTHIIAKRWEEYFEQRQERATFGFGLQRKTRNTRPMVVIFTTELITAKFAYRTFENLQTQFEQRRKIRTQADKEIEEYRKEYNVKKKYAYALSDYSPVTEVSHTTLIFTPLVRKRHHAMLIPIVQELKDKFPEEDLNFIANGLACEWNLLNVRGINSLDKASSIIKLSILHPHASLNLMVHFKDEQPKDIVMQLVADQANQAIGRNQGNRFTGHKAIVLCDPKYIGIEKLLRYQLTPWSSVQNTTGSVFKYADEETPMEKWLRYRLSSGRWFATSNIAEEYVKETSTKQQAIYWKWRKQII